MLDQISTYTDYVDSHPRRYALYLCGESSGHTKVINVVRSALDVAALATPSSNKEAHNALSQVNDSLGNIKLGLNFFRAYQSIPSLKKKFYKAQRSCQEVYRHWKRGESISKSDLLRVVMTTSYFVKKIISIIGDGVIKPFKFVTKCAGVSEDYASLFQGWGYVSLAKSGLKITHVVSQLVLGTKKIIKRVRELVFELFDLVIYIVSRCNITIHPAVTVTLSCCKSLFGFYDVYVKTA
ncbi:MAG: hypothetical protein S4CHLAM123_09590 [Chlamydiales bacterium]|nr:hypothetical protein [Chlamydiales bacterium]